MKILITCFCLLSSMLGFAQHENSFPESNHEYFLVQNGKKLPRKGTYTAFSAHLLLAKTKQDFERNKRIDLGAHLTSGYRFNQFLALGAGIGLDDYEAPLTSVFCELRGYLANTQTLAMPHAETTNGRRCPMSYGVQIGYNVPVDKFLGGDEEVKWKGGVLLYPSIGILFPARNGISLNFDIGYKIQRFQRMQPAWWANSVVDKYTFRSLAFRMGVVI